MLALPFVVIAGGALMVLLVSYSSMLIRSPLEEVADRLGIFGRFLRAVIGATVNFIVAPIRLSANAADERVGGWLNSIVNPAREVVDEVRQFAQRTKDSLGYIATTLIPAKIDAAVAPLRADIRAAERNVIDLTGDLANKAKALGARISALRDRVDDLAIAPLALLTVGLAALTERVTKEVARLAQAIATEATQPIGAIRDIELPRINLDLSDLRRAIGGLREWVAPVSLAFTGAAVIELLTHVRQCRSKTEKLCQFDMDAYDDLLGIAFVLPSLPLIVETIRQSAQLLDEVMPDLKETLR